MNKRLEVAPFYNDGLNVFQPDGSNWRRGPASRRDEALFLDIETDRVAAMADPTWDLQGYEIRVERGIYRIEALRVTGPSALIYSLSVRQIGARSPLRQMEIAGLDVDSGYAGLYVGGKWIISRSGRGDGCYPLYRLCDASGACVGIEVNFARRAQYEDQLERTTIAAPAPDLLSLRAPCSDCAVDLHNIGEASFLLRPGLPGGGFSGSSCYCVGCVEKRLDRKLVPEDFVKIGQNFGFGFVGARLAARRGDALPYEMRSARFFDLKAPGDLDARIPPALVDDVYRLLSAYDERCTPSNAYFTVRVGQMIDEAERLYPGQDPIALLRDATALAMRHGADAADESGCYSTLFAGAEKLKPGRLRIPGFAF